MEAIAEPKMGLRIDLREYRPISVFPGGPTLWSRESQALIRDWGPASLGRFLPRAVLDGKDESTVLFVLNDENGEEIASKSKPISGVTIPPQEFDDLLHGIELLRRRARSEEIEDEKRKIIDAFKLPDPRLDGSFYRTYTYRGKRRLLILWGCERRVESGARDNTSVNSAGAIGYLKGRNARKRSLTKLLSVAAALLFLSLVPFVLCKFFGLPICSEVERGVLSAFNYGSSAGTKSPIAPIPPVAVATGSEAVSPQGRPSTPGVSTVTPTIAGTGLTEASGQSLQRPPGSLGSSGAVATPEQSDQALGVGAPSRDQSVGSPADIRLGAIPARPDQGQTGVGFPQNQSGPFPGGTTPSATAKPDLTPMAGASQKQPREGFVASASTPPNQVPEGGANPQHQISPLSGEATPRASTARPGLTSTTGAPQKQPHGSEVGTMPRSAPTQSIQAPGTRPTPQGQPDKPPTDARVGATTPQPGQVPNDGALPRGQSRAPIGEGRSPPAAASSPTPPRRGSAEGQPSGSQVSAVPRSAPTEPNQRFGTGAAAQGRPVGPPAGTVRVATPTRPNQIPASGASPQVPSSVLSHGETSTGAKSGLPPPAAASPKQPRGSQVGSDPRLTTTQSNRGPGTGTVPQRSPVGSPTNAHLGTKTAQPDQVPGGRASPRGHSDTLPGVASTKPPILAGSAFPGPSAPGPSAGPTGVAPEGVPPQPDPTPRNDVPGQPGGNNLADGKPATGPSGPSPSRSPVSQPEAVQVSPASRFQPEVVSKEFLTDGKVKIVMRAAQKTGSEISARGFHWAISSVNASGPLVAFTLLPRPEAYKLEFNTEGKSEPDIYTIKVDVSPNVKIEPR